MDESASTNLAELAAELADFIPTALQIGAAAVRLGVSIDTLRRWERQGRIRFERVGGQRAMSSEEMERLLGGRRPPVIPEAPNRLAGVVVGVKRGDVTCQNDHACGPFNRISVMTTDAVDQLGLKPGVEVTAAVQATTPVVEYDQQRCGGGPPEPLVMTRTRGPGRRS